MSELKYTEKRARISKQITLKNLNHRNKSESNNSSVLNNNLRVTIHDYKVICPQTFLEFQ